jgi:uncharacterized membrane protein YukC
MQVATLPPLQRLQNVIRLLQSSSVVRPFLYYPCPCHRCNSVAVDPHLSTAKRQQRTQALNTTLSQAALERRLAAAETTRIQLETHLRERDATIERLEADRRLLSEREQEEREEKERVTKEREEEKVRGKWQPSH